MTPEDLKRAEQLAKEGDGLIIKDEKHLGKMGPIETVEIKAPPKPLNFTVHMITDEEADERAEQTIQQCLGTDWADRCYSHHMVDWDKLRECQTAVLVLYTNGFALLTEAEAGGDWSI